MRLVATLASVLAFSCSSPPNQLPAGALRQMDSRFTHGSQHTLVLVLAVDDAETSDAAALRETVADAFSRFTLHDLDEERDPLGFLPTDPTWWRPGDTRVILVRPSAERGHRVVTPGTHPDLAWTNERSTREQADEFSAAIRTLLDEPYSQTGAYELLSSVAHAVALVRRLRAPETTDEQSFVDSLPAMTTWVSAAIATTRDDESPLPPSVYAEVFDDEASDTLARATGALVPLGARASGSEGCFTLDGPEGRTGEWITATRADEVTWPCDAPTQADGLFPYGWVDYRLYCLDAPIQLDRDGHPECRFSAELPADTPCDAERGWLDPRGDDGERHPTIEKMENGEWRICEISYLEGDDLELCRTSLECPGCASGWCTTEVPELVLECTAGVFPRLRFVGGAMSARGVRYRHTCNLGER